MLPIPLRIIFFDLGDTLVHRISVTPARFGWIPGAKDLLERLRLAGVTLGLISNTGDLTRAQLMQMLPNDFQLALFESDLVLLSSEVHITKPDRRIFRLAINNSQNSGRPELRLQIDPAECLFVGENAEEVLSAQQVGMMGARVDPTSQSPDIGNLDVVLRDRGLLS